MHSSDNMSILILISPPDKFLIHTFSTPDKVSDMPEKIGLRVDNNQRLSIPFGKPITLLLLASNVHEKVTIKVEIHTRAQS